MRFFQPLFFIPLFLLAAEKSAISENYLRVDYLPKVVKQGDVCRLRAWGPGVIKSLYGEFQGKRFPMALSRPNKIYEGLIGIDLNNRPGKYEIKMVAINGGSRIHVKSLFFKVHKVEFKTQKLTLPPSMVDLDPPTLERVNQEAERLKVLFQVSREEKLWRGAFIRPVVGEVRTVFGMRRIINGQHRSPHTGVDLQAEEGSPVGACNTGVVVLVEQFFFSGKSVILDHGWGLYSMYFHLAETKVNEGDRIDKGAVLGRVGSTGRSTGPHLHWGIILKGARVDPLSLLRLTEQLWE